MEGRSDVTDSKLTRAYQHIKERIGDGRFVPGYRLVLAAVAKELDMSVVPVREAIRLLEAEGLVTFERNVGAQVAMINAAKYMSEYETLTVVESAAIAMAAPSLQPADLQRARDINNQMRLGINDFFDPRTFTQLNAEFHRTLWEACPNERLLDYVRRGWNRLATLRDSVFSFVPERAPHSVAEHARIIDLIAAGAPAAEIEAAVRAHRDNTIGALRDYQASHRHHDRAAIAAE
ncbi:MAG: GntR family transcriptional regulator [Salinibacterium sp.]|nr:GntR family transcriptional regulator [Salinibacterium sp.]